MAKSTKTESLESAAPPMKKIDAVRAALAEGIENPTAAVAHIKAKYGIEMSAQAFSTSKFQITRASGKKSPVKVFSSTASTGVAVQNGNGNRNVHSTINEKSAAELARVVKALVAAHGVEAVKSMADVFSE